MHSFVWIGIALLVLWAVLWLVFAVVSVFVHVIAVVAVVMIVWGLLKRGAASLNP
jgi:hypothetical protein